MTADQKQLAKQAYALGQQYFERGSYREAVACFEKAVALAHAMTPLGGEIQTWLANAYSAVGRSEEAIALCEKISRHPDCDTRKQGKRLLYILKAPKLQMRPEWNTQIPDLAAIAEAGEDNSGYSYPKPAKRKKPKQSEPDFDQPIDWSQINTQDNAFLWVALVGVALVLAGVAWAAY